jgi:RNA polymerase sigma-70 factor (ECF subfamily)
MLIARLYPLVMKIVRSHLPRRSAEEDLAQEVFIKMFRRLDQYQAAWLEYFTGSQPQEAQPRPDAEAAREAMQRLLSGLPAKDRLVLQLLDLEGRSVKEISAVTGWSVSLVKVRAFRARRRLRAAAEELRKEFL